MWKYLFQSDINFSGCTNNLNNTFILMFNVLISSFTNHPRKQLLYVCIFQTQTYTYSHRPMNRLGSVQMVRSDTKCRQPTATLLSWIISHSAFSIECNSLWSHLYPTLYDVWKRHEATSVSASTHVSRHLCHHRRVVYMQACTVHMLVYAIHI